MTTAAADRSETMPNPVRAWPALRPVRVRSGVWERLIEVVLLVAAVTSVAVTGGIVYVLIRESVPFFGHVSVWTFLTDTMWTPLFAEPRYGILPLLCGTVMTSLVALTVAIPLGSILAVWMSEFAPRRLRETIKPIVELLAAVPTIVYGYFALQLVTPFLQRFLTDLPTFNMLGPGIVMGLMIVPYVSSLSEDALRAVPMSLREGSYAMGANKIITALRVVYPAAISGIASAYVLGVSRAVGETMIVAVAAGQQPNLTLDPREPAATITAFIVQVSLGDLPHGTIGFQSIFAAGVTLFVFTLGFNIVGFWLRRRYREVY
jgi:phosphate transport system permease protein